MALRSLTISTTFPNPELRGLGVFVRARTLAVNQYVSTAVIAPLSCFTGRRISRTAIRVPRCRHDGDLAVFHPRWINLPGGSPVNALPLAVSVIRTVRRHRLQFDLLDAHFGYIDGVAAAIVSAVLKRPFVVTLRGSELLHAEYSARRRVMSWALSRAAAVIAVSAELAELAVKLGVAPKVIAVIPNGVNAEVFYPRSVQSRPSPRKHILSVGNLVRLKGHDRIIRSAAHLVKTGVDLNLTIIGAESSGEPGYGSELKALAAELQMADRICFAGYLSPEEIAVKMSSADVLCLASEREGCPNVVREALACGLPVVATCVGAVTEMIPDERFGLIVPIQNEPALGKALATALAQQWERDAIARWGASRSWKRVAQEVVQVMEHAIAG